MPSPYDLLLEEPPETSRYDRLLEPAPASSEAALPVPELANQPVPTALPGPGNVPTDPRKTGIGGVLGELLKLPASGISSTVIGSFEPGYVPAEEDLQVPLVSGETVGAVLKAPLPGINQFTEGLGGALRGLLEGTGDAAASFTSPESLALLPLGGGGKTAQRVIAGVFEGQAIAGTAEQWKAFNEAKTLSDKFRIGTAMGLGLAIPAAAFAHTFKGKTTKGVTDERQTQSEGQEAIATPETGVLTEPAPSVQTAAAPEVLTPTARIAAAQRDIATARANGDTAGEARATEELSAVANELINGATADRTAAQTNLTRSAEINPVREVTPETVLHPADTEMVKGATDSLGLRYDGIQDGQALNITNPKTGDTYTMAQGSTVADLQAKIAEKEAARTASVAVAEPQVETPTVQPAPQQDVLSPGPGAASVKEPLASYELRRFGERFQEDQSIDPVIREQTGNRYYEPISNKVTVTEAEGIIETRGTDESVRLVRDEAFPMQPRVRVTVGEALIKKLNQSHQEAKAAGDVRAGEFLEQAVDTAEYLSEFGTTLGQGVQAFAIWNKLTPEGRLVAVKRMVEKSRTGHKAEFGPEIAQVFEGIKKTESVERTKATKVAKAEKETAIEREANKIARILSDTPGWSKIAKGKRNEALALIRAHLREEQPDFVNRLSEFGAGRTLAESIDGMAIENRRRIDSVAEAREIQTREKKFGNIADRIAAQLSDTPAFTGGKGAIDPARQLILKHLVKPQPDFVQRIKQFGADAQTAETLDLLARNNRARVLAVDRAQRVEALQKQYAKNKVAGKLGKQDWERLVELNDAGLLNDQTFYEAVSERFGLPKFDKQVSADITRLNEAIEKAPEGFQRNEKTQDFLSYVSDLKGMNPADVPIALWYSNILSGFTTQLVNTIDTGLNVFSESAVMAASHPTAIPDIIGGLYRGMIKGGFEAASTLKTGRSISGDKIGQQRVLERVEFGKKGGVPISTDTSLGAFLKKAFELGPVRAGPLRIPTAGILNLWKYPLRAMVASDTVFFNSMKEARARFLARGIAKTEGLSGDALFQRVQETLNQSPETLNAALKQAQDEGLTGLQQRRRVQEIVEQGRSEELVDASNEAAQIATYNHEPSGVIGLVAHNIANITEGFPPGKAIAPFTRIVANVTNRGLNYTPWGYKRLFFGEWGGKKFSSDPPTGEAYRTQLVKATLGTTAMTAVALLDSNDTIQVTAGGPDSINEKRQLQNAGWKPYSVKIGDTYYSYQYTPFNLGFAMVGHYRDAIRYNKLSEKDATTRLAYGMLKSSSTILDMSFLSGVSDFLETIQGTTSSTKGAGRLFARTASSVVVPNLVKQIDKLFDPTIYQADSITQSLIRETPVARSIALKPMLNVLGEEIKPSQNRFFTFETRDPVWTFIVEKQAWVPVPSKTTKIKDRPITPDEYYRLIKESGPIIRDYIQSNLGKLRDMTGEDAQEDIQKESQRLRQIVKSRF